MKHVQSASGRLVPYLNAFLLLHYTIAFDVPVNSDCEFVLAWCEQVVSLEAQISIL